MRLSVIWAHDVFDQPHTPDTLDHHLKGKLSIGSPMFSSLITLVT